MAEESEKDKLKRLAAARVTKAVKSVRLVGNLARYKPTPNQTDAILGALEAAVKTVKAQFAGQAVPAEGFKLP